MEIERKMALLSYVCTLEKSNAVKRDLKPGMTKTQGNGMHTNIHRRHQIQRSVNP